MGCCAGSQADQEIMDAKTIDELIRIFAERKEKLPKEREEISQHLEDPKKEVEGINVEQIDAEVLAKRIPYLESLEENYDKVILKFL